MNTKVIVGVVAVLIIGIGAYLLFAKQTPSSQAPATTTTGTVSGPKSIAAMVSVGAPVTCTYSTTTSSGTQSGTIYVAQGMVAGDFQMSGQVTTQGHMIVRDSTSYVWMTMNGQTQAFKTAVNTNAQAAPGNQGVNYNSSMNYSCQPWTPDSSKFTLPAGVTFMDTSAMGVPTPSTGVSKPSTGTSVKGSAGQCAACGELQGAQKAQCLAALHC